MVAGALAFGRMAGCTGRGASEPSASRPLERWEVRSEWVFVSPTRCVTGPFSVEVPAFEAEFGRRLTVEVFGARSLPMDTRFVYADGSRMSGWEWTASDDAASNAACRGHGSAPGAVASGGGGAGAPPGPPRSGRGGAPPPPGTRPPDEPQAPPPTLDRFEGPLPPTRTQGEGIAWYPRGNPNLHDLDGVGTEYHEGSDPGGFRFEFWFHAPVDMQGVVIRIRAEALQPLGSLESYRATFDARVADVDRRMASLEVIHVGPSTDPAVGRVPPPPRVEAIPPAPRGEVEWLPGYWSFDASLNDFVWIGGTYVVRARVTQTPVAQAPPPPVTTQVAVALPPPPPPRTLEASIPPRPEPRVEVIPAPPAGSVGALWIAGYWELQGAAWTWVAGHWQLPVEVGARFRAPSIEVRGTIQLYLPGGWVPRAR